MRTARAGVRADAVPIVLPLAPGAPTAQGFFPVGVRVQFPSRIRKFRRVLGALVAAMVIAALVSCASAPGAVVPGADFVDGAVLCDGLHWEALCPGAQYALLCDRAVPLRCHLVKIDLSAAPLTVAAFPAQKSDFIIEETCTNLKSTDSEPADSIGIPRGAFRARSSVAVARSSGALVAVNAQPYAAARGGAFARVSRVRRLVGVHVVAGQLLSPPAPGYDALVLAPAAHSPEEPSAGGGGAARVVAQSDGIPGDAAFAFGGFWQILRSGEILPFKEIHDARTVAGVARGGTELILLVAEKRAFRSRGLSYAECAGILRALGAEDALEFDGGHASSLVVAGNAKKSYRPCARCGGIIGFVFR